MQYLCVLLSLSAYTYQLQQCVSDTDNLQVYQNTLREFRKSKINLVSKFMINILRFLHNGFRLQKKKEKKRSKLCKLLILQSIKSDIVYFFFYCKIKVADETRFFQITDFNFTSRIS